MAGAETSLPASSWLVEEIRVCWRWSMFRGVMGEDMGQARRTGLRQTGGPVTMDLKGAIAEVRELLESCFTVYSKRWLKSVFIEALFCARGYRAGKSRLHERCCPATSLKEVMILLR